jgi:hypothetical protein
MLNIETESLLITWWMLFLHWSGTCSPESHFNQAYLKSYCVWPCCRPESWLVAFRSRVNQQQITIENYNSYSQMTIHLFDLTKCLLNTRNSINT